MDTRYQYQSKHVKAYRWLRHMPMAYLRLVFWFPKWLATGAKPMTFDDGGPNFTRPQTISVLWGCFKGEAQYRMQYYYTSEEVIASLRNK